MTAPWFIWDAFVWKLSISKLGKLCLLSWFYLFLPPFNWVSVTIWDIKLLFLVETCRRAAEFLPLGDWMSDDSRTWFFSWFKYTFYKLRLLGLCLCCLFWEFCLIKVCSEFMWDPNGDDFAKERCYWLSKLDCSLSSFCIGLCNWSLLKFFLNSISLYLILDTPLRPWSCFIFSSFCSWWFWLSIFVNSYEFYWFNWISLLSL